MTHPRSLFAPPRRPYYIDAPAYRRTSAGIRVMHMLCHALNCAGEEAYVYPTVTNPLLKTPLLTQEIMASHQLSNRNPITVYPEVVPGNPRQSGSVVRYVLNKAGLLGGSATFDAGELVFAYGRNALPEGGDPGNILFLPPIDTQVFNNIDNPCDTHREGILFYPGRYQSAAEEYPHIADNATLITSTWPVTHQALAELFRRSELVYCFESTAIAVEATLCGCPAVILPSPLFDGTLLSESEIGRNGIAILDNPEGIASAKQTVGQMWIDYQSAETRFWQQLDHFVECTQAMPVRDVVSITGKTAAQMEIARQYTTWAGTQGPQEMDAQLLAERMVREWAYRPQFHLLMDLQPGEEPLLADTLDSLSTQLYAEWMLTVVTPLAAPDGIDDIQRVQWLSLKDSAHTPFVINEMAVHSSCHWVVRIVPGLTFEPHALLVAADAVNSQPEWALFYTDEDTREPDGSRSLPCFKPGPDPFMLRNQSYPGSFVAVRKDAFMTAGQFGSQLGAEVYDLTLRILDDSGVQALGHIDAMLVHLPRESARSTHTAAEAAAVQAHLLRQQTEAIVRNGESFGIRTLTPSAASLPSISILIECHGAPDQALQTARHFLTDTDYPAFEVLITEASGNPLHLQLLHLGTEQHEDGRLRVVNTSSATGKTDRIRLMLIASRSTHVLFVATESRAAHPAWLREMALAMAWPGVGAVQAALVNVAGGQMVCPPYSPAFLFSPVGLATETIHALPTQQRALSALDERAMLMPKSVLSGFLGRSQGIDQTYWALDLARHLQDGCLQMLWKPEVQVRLLSSVTQPPWFGVYTPPSLNPTDKDNVVFIQRQLEWLASSHLYNGQLSYSKPCQFNLNRLTEWDIQQGDRPKLLVLGCEGQPLPTESQRNLAELVQNALVQVSHWTLEAEYSPWITLMEIARVKPTAVLFGHTVGIKQKPLLELLRQYLPTVRRVFCADDGVDITPRTTSPDPQWVDLVCAVEDILQVADKVVVTSAAVAEALNPYHAHVQQVLPWLDWSVRVVPPIAEKGGKARIGLIHPAADPAVQALLTELMDAFKDDASFICFGEPPATLNTPRLIKVCSPHVSSVTHEHMQNAKLDMVLLPRSAQLLPSVASERLIMHAIAAGCACVSGPVAQLANTPLIQLKTDVPRWMATVRKILDSATEHTVYCTELQTWAATRYNAERGLTTAMAAYST